MIGYTLMFVHCFSHVTFHCMFTHAILREDDPVMRSLTQERKCLEIGIDWSFGPYTISHLARYLAVRLYNFRLLPLSVQVCRTKNFKQSATSFGTRRRLVRGTKLRTVTPQGLAPCSTLGERTNCGTGRPLVVYICHAQARGT
jgi:hypothetical protein